MHFSPCVLPTKGNAATSALGFPVAGADVLGLVELWPSHFLDLPRLVRLHSPTTVNQRAFRWRVRVQHGDFT